MALMAVFRHLLLGLVPEVAHRLATDWTAASLSNSPRPKNKNGKVL